MSYDSPKYIFHKPAMAALFSKEQRHFIPYLTVRTDQLNAVTQSSTLCDPMGCSTPEFLVHHQLQEFTQTNVH